VPVIADGVGLTVIVVVAVQPAVVVYVTKVVPEAIPKTVPVAEPIVAIEVLLLLHVPPVTASVKVDVAPAQTSVVPEIEVIGLTVITVVAIQFVGAVYVIIAVPPVTPFTVPDVPTVAMPVLLLLHVPPDVMSLKVVDVPAQTIVVPVTDAGNGFIVTVVLP
jgi:hypothetical protein